LSVSSDEASDRRGRRSAQHFVDVTDALDHRGRSANDAEGRFIGQRVHGEPLEIFIYADGREAL